MRWLARHSGKLVLFMGMFLIGRAGWSLFHAQALQAVFDLVIGFYLVQDYKIDQLRATVNILAKREIDRSEKEMMNGEGPSV